MTRTGAIALEISNLRKRYGQKVAVDDLSLRVNEGEIFGILGPNGAGKTTTVECAEGLRHPDGGTVRVFGIDPYRDRTEARQLVGVQLQESQLPDKITVTEALNLYASFYPRHADTEALLTRLGRFQFSKCLFPTCPQCLVCIFGALHIAVHRLN